MENLGRDCLEVCCRPLELVLVELRARASIDMKGVRVVILCSCRIKQGLQERRKRAS